jgi:hypothetical protein
VQNVEFSIIIRVAIGYLAKFHDSTENSSNNFSRVRAICMLEQFDLRTKDENKPSTSEEAIQALNIENVSNEIWLKR